MDGMKVHYLSQTDLWSTPQATFNELHAEFDFNLDPCATPENAKCPMYFTKETDGLKQNWRGFRVFMNPPYGREIGKWMRKACESDTLVVCLVPARTDTQWWHDYAMKGEIRFIKGRLKFGGANNSAPFPSAIVIFKADNAHPGRGVMA
jgi:phage N-6-adenine-methyltransferase